MPKKRKSLSIEPRELFIMLESLALAMDVLKNGKSYRDMSRETLRQHNEAHDLFLKLEEVWDAMPARDRDSGVGKESSAPFDVRNVYYSQATGRTP